jgi:transposase InsO family protein
MAALRMALSRRTVQPGLVHHSDRGSQYASNDYMYRTRLFGHTFVQAAIA